MLLVCDTNVWIEASRDPRSGAAQLLNLSRSLECRVALSKHSRAELAAGTGKFGSAAEDLASGFAEIPYWPIGKIDELLGTISKLAGTIDDIRANDDLREELGRLAKRGTDIRDRGALIDALRSNASYFITSDKGICGGGPRARIEEGLPIRIRTASEMQQELTNLSFAAG